MDNRPRSKIKQTQARKKKFSHNQYWCVSYTECYEFGGEQFPGYVRNPLASHPNNKGRGLERGRKRERERMYPRSSDSRLQALDLTERDFKTIIKARSAELAKEILILRLKEDEHFLKIRSVTVSMVHECWQIAALRKKLTIEQWDAIRNVSFPNDWNRLFKFEKKRIKGQFNRFNVPHTILSNEHKKKLSKACNKLVEAHLKDSFKPFCPKLREICCSSEYCKTSSQRKGFATLRDPKHRSMELAFLKESMAKYHGNIQWAADSLGIHRSSLRRGLARFTEVDWVKDFPLSRTRVPKQNSMDSPESRAKLSKTLQQMGHKPPPNKKGTPQYKKWLKSITPTLASKKDKLYSEWKERVTNALREHKHKRTETAEALGITNSHLIRLMKRFVKEDPEFEKEFWSKEISMRLKEASCRKTRKANRLKFIKENKHLIMQAYHQNDKLDHKAAKMFEVDTRTFTRWREEMEQHEI